MYIYVKLEVVWMESKEKSRENSKPLSRCAGFYFDAIKHARAALDIQIIAERTIAGVKMY